jgi:hypothetical protein
MTRLYVILGFITVALYVYALVDSITIHDSRIKSLNKASWIFIIIILPLIGSILWLTIGKARGSEPVTSRQRDARRPLAPDDDPEFLRNATRAEEQEARIRQLEAELKALDDDPPKE